jgi:hypothetical protein
MMGTTKTNLDKILIQKKKAIHTVMKLQESTPVKNLFHELGILTVYNVYILEIIIFSKQIQLTSSSKIGHSYNTRLKINLPQHKLEYYAKKTTYAGQKFVQYIPLSILQENFFLF